MTKKIVAIWAQDEKGLIGKNQTLPWHLPADLQHFKETTLHQAILMGRVTFDGMGKRLLPKRISLILTKDEQYEAGDERALVFHSVEDVLAWYEKQDCSLYIIGGSQIFTAFEAVLDELVVTDIQEQFEGDTYFSTSFDWNAFEEVASNFYPKDEKNAYDFTVRRWRRKEL
ncbi:dihydrofolate reductase [Streptococcus himalayensis]|uniref:Dihydrofolate reductase n=1 Tax=Streptococcus himalayensis TaxID=1888195 RepID=A0A917EDM6_9STRE|nr:dihydrofolate reductase [Streptococcus himalayensis]GGE28072.1 dihydrofolate reductase [Streptococcus himalayensis]